MNPVNSAGDTGPSLRPGDGRRRQLCLNGLVFGGLLVGGRPVGDLLSGGLHSGGLLSSGLSLATAAGGPAAGRDGVGPAWLAPPSLPPVTLRDARDRPWTLAQALNGARVVVISFFFTGCQSICPPQTALLREATRRLQAQGRAKELRLVALSVDPLGDGPVQLQDFARRFELPLLEADRPGAGGDWLLLSGERVAVDRSLVALGQRPGAPQEHGSLLWVVDVPRSRWTRTAGLNPPEVLVDLVTALEA